MWSPSKDTEHDSLATTGDYLRIWKVATDGSVEDPPALLNNVSALSMPSHNKQLQHRYRTRNSDNIALQPFPPSPCTNNSYDTALHLPSAHANAEFKKRVLRAPYFV